MKKHTLCLFLMASFPLVTLAQVVPANPDPDPFGTANEDEYLDTCATGRWWDLATYPPANYFTKGLFFNKQDALDLVKNQPRDKTVAFALYTHDSGVLKLTAQLYPLKEGEQMMTHLDLDFGSGWTNVASVAAEYPGWFARYRIENWDNTLDVPYRVRHDVDGAGGTAESSYAGLIRHDPAEKDTIVMAALGCIGQSWTDRMTNLVAAIEEEDPDVVFFSGDQYYVNYEHTAGWLNFGLQMKETFRNRPAMVIMDDHDYSFGNVWGAGGKQDLSRGSTKGGFYWSAEFINMVQAAMTSHLPDPYDPTPVDRGIGVYYTRMRVGGIDFALLEDRKWKSGPGDPGNFVQNSDKITDETIDTMTFDKPGLVLLGQRQLDFLDDWAQDWRGAEMKTVLSQTTFASVPQLHGGSFQRQVANLDANGWPQTPRNNALRAIRRAKALHVCGDQHMASVVQYGIDGFRDAGFGFTTCAAYNTIFPRAWSLSAKQIAEGGDNPREATTLPDTGDFLDGFQNPITMLAYGNLQNQSNPAWKDQPTRRDGFGIVRYHKPERTMTIESWDCYEKEAEATVQPGGAAPAMLAALETGAMSNSGTSVPAGDIIVAQNLNQTTAGNRPVQWNNSTQHSLIGQSFTATADATLGGIALTLNTAEDFSQHSAQSFRLKVFAGTDSSAAEIGSFEYDATGLGSAAVGDWIRFGLGSGVPVTTGSSYTFLVVCGSEDPDHLTSFKRTKETTDYAGGAEMRAGNNYDIANWETDPWDVVAGATQDDVDPQAGHLLFSIDGSEITAPPTTNETVTVAGRWQHPGWPITIKMDDNDGRAVTHVLPEMEFAGYTNPVVQVVQESDGEILYTERIQGSRWTPEVYAAGTYTVKVGADRPDGQTFSGIAAVPAASGDSPGTIIAM